MALKGAIRGLVPPQKPHMHKIVMEISRYKNE